jgi:Uma2 family endonuclease
MKTLDDYPLRSKAGEPLWEMASLYPPQGRWSLDEYLSLTTNRLIEFDHGFLEFLPMPTEEHQEIVANLFGQLFPHINASKLGLLLFAPMRVQVGDEKVREPDILFMRADHADKRANRVWQGADLVVEVVSENPGDHERDYIKKRADYEAAGVSEYWIVDPKQRLITVLKLADGRYVEHCVARPGDSATSALLDGFEVEVASVFNRSET